MGSAAGPGVCPDPAAGEGYQRLGAPPPGARGAQADNINRGLATLRRFGAWLVAERLLAEHPAQGVRDLPLEARGPRALPDDVVDAVLRAVQAEAVPALRLRGGALLALLAYAGLHAQEACAVQLRDLDLDGGSLMVRRGKGRKAHRIPLHR